MSAGFTTTYRTDDRATRLYAEGIIAAAHGWPVCPYDGGQYRREWELGYRDEIRTQAGRLREPVRRVA